MPKTQKINVPPPEGSINLTVGEELTIHAAQACSFCCTIGSNFSPDLTSVELNQGDNGPYTAETKGTGTYNTGPVGGPCASSPVATAKSIQVG